MLHRWLLSHGKHTTAHTGAFKITNQSAGFIFHQVVMQHILSPCSHKRDSMSSFHIVKTPITLLGTWGCFPGVFFSHIQAPDEDFFCWILSVFHLSKALVCVKGPNHPNSDPHYTLRVSDFGLCTKSSTATCRTAPHWPGFKPRTFEL